MSGPGFGAELRRTREEAGISREEVGKLTGYVTGTIAQMEIGERFPQAKLIECLDEHFQTSRFSLIYQKLLRRDAYPESFRPWVDIEQEATSLRSYELSLIPGLRLPSLACPWPAYWASSRVSACDCS